MSILPKLAYIAVVASMAFSYVRLAADLEAGFHDETGQSEEEQPYRFVALAMLATLFTSAAALCIAFFGGAALSMLRAGNNGLYVTFYIACLGVCLWAYSVKCQQFYICRRPKRVFLEILFTLGACALFFCVLFLIVFDSFVWGLAATAVLLILGLHAYFLSHSGLGPSSFKESAR
jgi:hypothetical protein